MKVAETAVNKWNVDEFGNGWRKFQKRYVKKMRGMANRVECIARGHAVHSVKIDGCMYSLMSREDWVACEEVLDSPCDEFDTRIGRRSSLRWRSQSQCHSIQIAKHWVSPI